MRTSTRWTSRRSSAGTGGARTAEGLRRSGWCCTSARHRKRLKCADRPCITPNPERREIACNQPLASADYPFPCGPTLVVAPPGEPAPGPETRCDGPISMPFICVPLQATFGP